MSKLSKRLLSWMLLVAMLCTLLPTAVFADDSATTGGDDDFMKIVHLDCGRKYFTADWIKSLITEMAADGYTHLELAFGNDGLRFLLDDMSVTVNGETYSDADVTAAIQSANKAYYDAGEVNELTQTEMDEIIAHATAAGIEIIPLLNTPGHMDAIVTALASLTGNSVGYDGSASTIDLENETAVAFTKALVKKYAVYFAGQGSTVFNMGADEYANDYTSGSMGFGALMTAGKYQLFVNYVNELASIIEGVDMSPMAFNDGIYFQGNTDYTFDTDIMISFWSSGWGTYYSLSASKMAEKGHKMINTHGDYYYVLGKNDAFTPDTTTTHDPDLYTAAANFSNTEFMSSTISGPTGSMFCIWCDYPGAETETEVAENTRLILRAMGLRMNDTDIDGMGTDVVSGGFNADGTLNEVSESETTKPIPDAPASLIVGDTATLSVDETATWNSSKEAVVTIKEAQLQAVEGASVEIKAVGAGTATISAVTESGTTYASDITVVAEDTDAEDTIVENGSSTEVSYVLDTDGLDEDASYLIVRQKDNNANALSYANGSFSGLSVTVSGTSATVSSSNTALWTYKDGGLYNENAKVYLNITSSIVTTSTSVVQVTVTNKTSGKYTVAVGSNYLWYKSNVWSRDTQGQELYFYKYTPATTFKVDAAKQEARISSLTVTNDGYTDESWSAYQSALTAAQSKLAEVKAASYSTEAAANTALNELIAAVNALETAKNNLKKAVAITINYVDEDGDTVKTETKRVAETAESVTLTSPIYDDESNTYVLESTTLTLTLPGTTTYTVKVAYVAENLSIVDPLTVEYWQTNSQVVENIGDTVYGKSITAESAYSEGGIELTSIIPQVAYKKTAVEGDAALTYWRCRLLTRSTNEQTDSSGDDESLNGVTFTKVRYWNGSWAVYTENNEWVTVNASDYQLVAYYMNNMSLADEVSVGTSDWGKKGDGTLGGEYLGSDHVSIAFQVVYEDGTTSPATTSAADLDSVTYLVDNWGTRGVGTIALNQIGDYQIWKVTAETGTHTTTYSGQYVSTYVTNFEWDDNELTVWEGDPVSQYTIINPAGNPSTDGAYANLTWNETNESILIRIYLKTVETEDSLAVVYYDEKFGDTLYSYNISVENGDTFDDITPTPSAFSGNSARIDVSGCGIVNALGKTQYFQTDLTLVPEAVGKYNSELYTYTGSEISEDGKTLYLYYNINTEILSPNFVVDFGLPLTFELGDIVNAEQTVKQVSVNENTRYGTLSYNADTKIFTYTPTQVLPNIDVLSINILFDGADEATTTNVGVTPANNVMYEENFLTASNGWDSASAITGTQATVEAGDYTNTAAANDLIYGYDSAYAEDTGNFSNGHAISATVTSGCTTTTTCPKATFTFTGTGFELMSLCGTNTGVLFVNVTGTDDNDGKAYLVDTYYTGSLVYQGSTTNLNTTYLRQVPVVHELDLVYDTYTVEVYGMYLAGSGATKTQSLDSGYDTDAILTMMGCEGKEIEVISVNGGAADDTGDSLYVTAPNTTASNIVYIDGIRVYNPLGTGTTSVYDSNEDVATFESLYDIAASGWNESVVYVEDVSNNGNDVEKVNYADYKVNGPENEIYLKSGAAIAFTVESGTVLQVSAKAINGTANMTYADGAEDANGAYGTSVAISSQTEMYYQIASVNNVVYIKNTGDGVLSLIDVKFLKGGTSGQSLDEDTISSLAYAVMRPAPETDDSEDVDPEFKLDEWVNPYTDVKKTDWFYPYVGYATFHGLMDGMGNSKFQPDTTTSRAMVVTVLWRMAGSPEPTGNCPFTDVEAGSWYEKAVTWAAENEIVKGVGNNRYAPDENITREQLVTMVYRYCVEYKEYAGEIPASIAGFVDDHKVSDWAEDAMKWTVSNGIINGMGNNDLQPATSCKRSMLATVMTRVHEFCELFEN